MRVEVALDGANTVLRSGMYGSVSITLADLEEALLVPASVLVTGGGAPSVMIASSGRAERRAIEVGQNDGVPVHVLTGLSDNDQVIAEGKDACRDGQPVEVITRSPSSLALLALNLARPHALLKRHRLANR